jgi:hypothetical protein
LSEQSYEIPVTKEQFENTVDRWIKLMLGLPCVNNEGNYIYCGFCDAMNADKTQSCNYCALIPKYCGGEKSAYNRWEIAEMKNQHKIAKQAALELLEGLYDYGVKHGFIDPCGDCALGQECVCVNTSVE